MLLVQGAIALCRSAVAVVVLPAVSVIAAGISSLHLTYARLIASKLIGQHEQQLAGQLAFTSELALVG